MKAIDTFIEKELMKGSFPGGALGIFTKDQVYYSKAFGYAQLMPEKIPMALGTLFDLASLTKVIAATTSLFILLERGQIHIYDSIKNFFPEVERDKEEITLFHLLTHTSGLPAIVQLFDFAFTKEEKIQYLLNLPLHNRTGGAVLYSDPNFILLGNIVERVSGYSLHHFAEDEIFKPLGMEKTTFNPREKFKELGEEAYGATEFCQRRQSLTPGLVHDENAYFFGGVSGHAGLFAPLSDLMLFGQMLLKEGKYKGGRLLTSRTIELMRRDWTSGLNAHRGWGWDLIKSQPSSGGILFSCDSYGHTGFTGTSMWFDPNLPLGVVFLTNRVHPTRNNRKILSARPKLHNLIYTIFH